MKTSCGSFYVTKRAPLEYHQRGFWRTHATTEPMGRHSHVKCLRCGCSNPRANPDVRGLGLCTEHYRQLSAGTIGQDHDTRTKQHDIQDAKRLLDEISHPTESLRTVAHRTGLSKDVVRSIRIGQYRHLRSADWETLVDAVAQHRYTRPKPISTPAVRGTQLHLFDIEESTDG